MGLIRGLNKDVLARIVKELGIQTLTEASPLTLVESIQPVLIANPDHEINIIRNSTSSGTLFVVPSDRDFFITSVFVTATAVNGDGGTNTITVTPQDGASQVLASVDAVSGTVATEGTSAANNMGLAFPKPIKLKGATSIVTSKGSTTGTFGITGYTVDKL